MGVKEEMIAVAVDDFDQCLFVVKSYNKSSQVSRAMYAWRG